MFNIAPHGKYLSDDLITRIVAIHKDDLGYKKFGISLELSYISGQGHTEVFQNWFHSEQAS